MAAPTTNRRRWRIAIALATAAPLLIAYGVVVFLRPLATRGDLEQLVAGRLNGDAALASEVCGAPVQGLMWPTPKLEELRYGEWPWAHVTLQSMKPFFSKSGTATARVSGVGVDARQKAMTDMRAARVSFAYQCDWEDNGRSSNFVCTIPGRPTVTRE